MYSLQSLKTSPDKKRSNPLSASSDSIFIPKRTQLVCPKPTKALFKSVVINNLKKQEKEAGREIQNIFLFNSENGENYQYPMVLSPADSSQVIPPSRASNPMIYNFENNFAFNFVNNNFEHGAELGLLSPSPPIFSAPVIEKKKKRSRSLSCPVLIESQLICSHA